MRISHQHYLIVDVEATCSNDGAVPRDEMEIIEIGALMQNATSFEVESEFQTFVKPARHPALTSFCNELTSIRQQDVDEAPPFADVIHAMNTWAADFDDALFCSWGDYDKKQFHQDCRYHRIEYPFKPDHLNLKAEFSRSMQRRKRYGIAGAVRLLGMQFQGTQHRGIDDVRNIAAIVRRVCTGNG